MSKHYFDTPPHILIAIEDKLKAMGYGYVALNCGTVLYQHKEDKTYVYLEEVDSVMYLRTYHNEVVTRITKDAPATSLLD